MKTAKFTYWQEGDYFLGFLNEYPEYQTHFDLQHYHASVWFDADLKVSATTSWRLSVRCRRSEEPLTLFSFLS